MTYERIKHIVLALLILLSLYLSFNIWMPVHPDEDESTLQTDNQFASSLVERDVNEVYSPHQFILHRDGSYAIDPVVFNDLYTELIETMQFDNLEIGEEVPGAEYYANLADSNNELELVFPSALPFGLFAENFNNIPTDLANTEFNRLHFNVDNPEVIYFYNSRTNILNEVAVEEFNLTGLDDLLTLENHMYRVYLQSVMNDFIYLPDTSVTFEASHHVVERLPNNLYSTHFFPDPSGVELRVSNNISRYIDLTTELRINNETNVLTYYRQLSDLNEMTRTERFEYSKNELDMLENWTNEIRYVDTDEQLKQVIYRRFFDGLPIFSEDGLESISEVGVLEGGLAHLKLPLLILQTPITVNEDTEVELDSGITTVNELSTVIDVNEIENLTIGLDWMDTDESNQVIRFEPKWFVKMNGYWTPVDTVIEEGDGG